MDDSFERVPNLTLKARLTVFGAICLNLLNGTCLLWGTISSYVISYIYLQGDTSVSFKKGVIILPFNLIFSGMMYPIGAYLFKRVNPKTLIFTGCSILLCSIFKASTAKTWEEFVLYFGILMPLGMGMQNFVPIMCAWEYYPENKGFISGLLVCSWGMGAFVFAWIMTMVVNPNDLIPVIQADNYDQDLLFDEKVASRMPMMFKTTLIIQFALAVFGLLTVTRPKQIEKISRPDDDESFEIKNERE